MKRLWMRRSAFLLSMLAALAGTPLRQSEAASDLSRSLTEISQEADIEAPDGGVGDDSGVVILTASYIGAAENSAHADLFFFPPLVTSITASVAVQEALWERVWWPQSPPLLRFAWLQVFRF